jgi:hypothetical protein
MLAITIGGVILAIVLSTKAYNAYKKNRAEAAEYNTTASAIARSGTDPTIYVIEGT